MLFSSVCLYIPDAVCVCVCFCQLDVQCFEKRFLIAAHRAADVASSQSPLPDCEPWWVEGTTLDYLCEKGFVYFFGDIYKSTYLSIV